MTPDTIKQRRITVPTDGGDVVVRRMRWKASREFMLALASQIRAVGLIGRVDLTVLLAKVEELIKSTERLVEMLVSSTTDLEPAQIDDLDLLELAQVIDVAIELNLGDDLKNCWTGIGRRIRALMGDEASGANASMPMPSMAGSTPTSSMPGTAPTT